MAKTVSYKRSSTSKSSSRRSSKNSEKNLVKWVMGLAVLLAIPVTILLNNNSQDTRQRASGSCTRTNPKIMQVSQDRTTIKPGETARVIIYVRNQDTLGCGESNIGMQVYDSPPVVTPETWNIRPEQEFGSAIDIKPLSGGKFVWLFTAPVNAVEQDYSFKIGILNLHSTPLSEGYEYQTETSVTFTVSKTAFGGADTTAPVVTITSPIDGTELPIFASTRYEAKATDETNVQKIELYVNGAVKKTCTTKTCTLWWKPVDGLYTLEAKAYDNAGNVGTSLQSTVNTPPKKVVVQKGKSVTLVHSEGYEVTVKLLRVDPLTKYAYYTLSVPAKGIQWDDAELCNEYCGTSFGMDDNPELAGMGVYNDKGIVTVRYYTYMNWKLK
jgi:hypothetical protein